MSQSAQYNWFFRNRETSINSNKQERPKVINFQANDICNLSCRMCNIWTKKLTTQLSPNDLRVILHDPFFSEVEAVGITGGEPTLRSDLVELYQVCIEELPSLKAMSFITNGSLPAKALSAYGQVAELCKAKAIDFSGMVSIDGIGQVHDKVRGKPKVFDRALETLTELKKAGIKCHACCTIVKSNIYYVQETLDYFKSKGVYIRFRVAEFIQRLYNEGLNDEIKNFTAKETAHLVSFYLNLLATYEHDPRIRRTYTSIVGMLVGEKRKIKCPYQRGVAINLTSKGEYSYCAPKGQLHLGKPDYGSSYNAHLPEREEILKRHCADCIHDYHDEWTEQYREDSKTNGWDDIQLRVSPTFPSPEPKVPGIKSWNTITICGWYGTETAGDIAILKGIISQIRQQNPGVQVQVLSLFAEYTKAIVKMWQRSERDGISVLSYHQSNLRSRLSNSQAIIMGGGPLMDLAETRLIADLFLWASSQEIETIVWGCGVGPLNNQTYRQNVTEILKVASHVTLRDHASLEFAEKLYPVKPYSVVEDPSITHLRSLNMTARQTSTAPVRLFVRELTHEYPQETSPDESFNKIRKMILDLMDRYPDLKFEMWAMHFFGIGGDDRTFAQKIKNSIIDDHLRSRLDVIYEPKTPEEILNAMATSSVNICMRFHSVVFAQTIGSKFIAIDYTSGGKIAAFLKERKLDKLLIPLTKVDTEVTVNFPL